MRERERDEEVKEIMKTSCRNWNKHLVPKFSCLAKVNLWNMRKIIREREILVSKREREREMEKLK